MSYENRVSRSKLHGLWALTNRELKKWYKTPVVFILTLIQPVIWLGLLGNALNMRSLVSSGRIRRLDTARHVWHYKLHQLYGCWHDSIHGIVHNDV